MANWITLPNYKKLLTGLDWHLHGERAYPPTAYVDGWTLPELVASPQLLPVINGVNAKSERDTQLTMNIVPIRY